jgi:hypothetical protein
LGVLRPIMTLKFLETVILIVLATEPSYGEVSAESLQQHFLRLDSSKCSDGR